MNCATCGMSNEPGRKFCKECGARLSSGCLVCGAANGPDDKFCGECGSALGQALPAVSATETAASRGGDTERRLVSVLFVDLVGFTTFSEGRDAEDVRNMLTRYFDAASDAVQRHGGSVEKFIGDAVMAVWGTPVAHEDDAERAVRSALEIVDRVGALGASMTLDLKARAGVLTGEAIAALGAIDQGLVTGDLVNSASRLQSAAAPGTVLVGERTYRSISESIACVPVEPLSLKGKAEQLAAWQALRVISERGGSNRSVAPEPPFGGRDDELRLAKELLHATGREGRPRLVHVTGVAGIGKSRLMWELQKYVDGLTETFLWHQGRCPSYGEGVTFWALAEMVRGRARIADTDDTDTVRARLSSCLEEYVTDAEERRWLEPRLGHLIGLDSPSGDRDELFAAWRRFFERVAEQGTTLLVFEDLQWADPGLLDFVESLLEWSRTSPIMVLTMARPELSDRRPMWGVGVRNSSTVHLDRLTDVDIEAMVTGYVEGLPSSGLARLVSRAEGVPMYAVETVRMLAARGVLEQTGQSYRVLGALGGELDIPETLHALVAARLDGLPEVERSLVQDASVAGHSFTLATVCAVSGRIAADLEPVLRTLVRKEVLDQDVDPRSPERGQYRFVQSVIQEVAYSTLSKAGRRSRHLACARWYEALGEDELASVVADHYLEAYRSDPGATDAEEIADHARVWLVRAGDRASSLGSPEQAYRYAEQALSLAANQVDRAVLNARAALAASAAGDAHLSWSHLVSACDDFAALGDAVAEARLLAEIGRLDYTSTETADVIARLLDVEARLPDGNVIERANVLSALATDAAHAGQVDASLRYSEQALVLAQTVDGDAAMRPAVAARSFALMLAGRHFESRLFLDVGVDMARRSGSPTEQGRALMYLGVSVMEDDPRAALNAMLECAELTGRAGVRPMQGMALANSSEGAVDIGEWHVADRTLAELALLTREASADDDGAAMTKAMLMAHRGDPSAALAALADLESRRGHGWDVVGMRTWFLRAQAVCLFLAGDSSAAAETALISIDLDPAGSNAPTSLWIAVQAASGLREAAKIRTALEATATLRGHWTALIRDTAAAAVACLEGSDGAGPTMAEALDAWSGADLPLDHASATLCALCVLPAADIPAGHVERARTYLSGLRATSMLRLYDARST
jgi:class 3 adenylate cyclase/tetratricopeptide (TPR) repeat protein